MNRAGQSLRLEAELFRLAWLAYAKGRPNPGQESSLSRPTLTVLWRHHYWLILLTWRGLMQTLMRPGLWASATKKVGVSEQGGAKIKLSDRLEVVFLVLSGALIDGDQLDRVSPAIPGIRFARLGWRRWFGSARSWPWPRTVGNRLRDLQSIGLLSKPDEHRLG